MDDLVITGKCFIAAEPGLHNPDVVSGIITGEISF